ncbi:MAG: 2-oxoacid:acceptor oxidoreductase family protein [Spirochaetales bacterium]|nr:2-oxoacid:acceptor oxidoreductase family protein [Spirochaetales bacterium]
MIHSIFLTGLGGQGVLTIAGILADHAAESGLKSSLFNAKGMAQRGGRVTSEIRLSPDPEAEFGARISAGGADVLLGMEIGETISSLSFLKPGGTALLLEHAQVPAEAVLKKRSYPSFDDARRLAAEQSGTVFAIEKPQSPHNVFALGVFAVVVPAVQEGLAFYSPEGLERALTRRLKRGLEENLEAFHRGCAYGRSLLQRV